jgi:hypothetical protein
VHRYGESDAVGPLDEGLVPGLDRDVDGTHLVATGAQCRSGRGHVHGLVPELVGRNKQDAHLCTL